MAKKNDNFDYMGEPNSLLNELPGVELRQEEYIAMQNQLANLQNQIAVAQGLAVKEKQRADEITTVAQRLQADFDNYRKRNNESVKKAKEDGVCDVLEKLIPTLDVFKKAISMITDKAVAEGVQMIYRKINEMITAFGVIEIPALGEQFNPEVHNALEQVKVKDPAQVGLVVEVFQKGYRMGERVLRHSVVKVAI